MYPPKSLAEGPPESATEDGHAGKYGGVAVVVLVRLLLEMIRSAVAWWLKGKPVVLL